MGWQVKSYQARVLPYRNFWSRQIKWKLVDSRGGYDDVLIRGTREEVERVAKEIFCIDFPRPKGPPPMKSSGLKGS